MTTQTLSNEYIETREDEIAHLIIDSENVDKLRQLANILRDRNLITTAYYLDLRDTLDHLSAGILIAKRNTAALRNGGRQ